MREKDRFVNALTFGPVDRAPLMEICLWQQTRERWVREGLPPDVDGAFMDGGSAYFGLEGYESVHIDAIAPYPAFEQRVLEETEESVLFTDGLGRTRRALKTGTVGGQRMSMDTYLEFAVKNRQDFAALRRRYEGPVAERYPADWPRIRDALRQSSRPITLLNPLAGTFGYYSMLRNWMGTEGLSYLLYDDPGLVRECLEFLTEFALRLLEPALREVQFDFYYVHEDMCYKNGPLVSPAMFREMFLPQYKRFVGFLKSHGIRLVLVDTDGNHEVLIPAFLEAGVDGFGPIERAADMDPVKLRKQYGRAVCMVGGIDKRPLAADRRAIEREVDRTIRPLIEEGGFIPTVDHAVPPDVSLENFRYYLDVKRKALGA